MKIVDLTTFLTYPAGTLFSKYARCYFEDLRIKGDNSGSMDFGYQAIASAIACQNEGEFAALLDDSLENGTSIRLDFDCGSRDGCFEEKQLFAVWELQDMEQLITCLLEAKAEIEKNKKGPVQEE